MRQKFTVPRVAGGDVELLSVELLDEHARRLAALLSIAPRGSGPRRTHLKQLKAHMRVLREVYALLAEDARQEAVSPAAEWLLDNFHVVSAAARDIQHDLPPSFFKRLPLVAADEFAGLAADLRARHRADRRRAPAGSTRSACSGSSAPSRRSRR